MTKKIVNEEFAAADHDANGGGSMVQDPVNTGDPHAQRGADNTDPGERDVAHAPGIGDVPRAAVLKALLMKLSTLSPDILAKIANEIDAENDVTANPSASTDGLQAPNLSSISVKEDIDEMFAGQELSEEFRNKAALIFEAVVASRVEVVRAELEEAYEERIESVTEQVVEELTNTLDKFITYTAEEFIKENKIEIETTIESTLAEEFMNRVANIAEELNIKLPQDKRDLVEELQAEKADLQKQLDEQLSKMVELAEDVKKLKIEKIFESATANLTETRKARVKTLAEGVEYGSADDYSQKLNTLIEGLGQDVVRKPTNHSARLIIENKQHDGVQSLVNEDRAVVSEDSLVASTVQLLSKMK